MANPFRPLHLHWSTSQSLEEIRADLRRVTTPSPTTTADPTMRFWGRVTDTTFRLRLAESRRNSLYTVITGTFSSEPTGSRISTTLRLPGGTVVLLVIFLAALNTGLFRHVADPDGPVSIGLIAGLLIAQIGLLSAGWAIALSSRADAVRALTTLWGPPDSSARMPTRPRAGRN